MKKFIIVSNIVKDPELKIAYELEERMKKTGAEVCGVHEMNDIKTVDVGICECVLVVGGDGTMLRVAKDIMDYGLPIIGVNLGDLGFLTEIEITNIENAIGAIMNDKYHIEERMMLDGVVCRENKLDKVTSALNDVVLSRRGDLQIIGYRVYVNGLYLNDFFADGIILSTPTGSTGYNMSAGGPIVEPKAQLMVLTPVSPHTLSTRSIMLSASDKVEVEILPPKGNKGIEVGVYFDGGDSKILTEGDKVSITKGHKVIRILKISDMSFLEVLHKKMAE